MKTGAAHERALVLLLIIAVTLGAAPSRARWGEHGHRISGRAAATNMPPQMPLFFREAVGQLEYLTPEPDRWRVRELVEMDEAFAYDHYIDLEVVPDSALAAADRYEYLEMLVRSGMQNPEQRAGLLPFRILELYHRLTVGFAAWRRAPDDVTRGYIEQRIINDAGLLGHYVTDGANPHHTTIHFNGWAADAPNPRGFTTDRTFHARFESEFVGAQITFDELIAHVSNWPREIGDPRAAVFAFLRTSNSLVERLYELEQMQRFDAMTTSIEHERFAIERLAAGVEMLRSLWWSAWQRSAALD